MKAVIQRVLRCSVTVDHELISSIQDGLFVLVGISQNDTDSDLEYMARKILNLRLFDDDNKRWSKNVMDKQYEVLCVSQFTLCYKLKGNKPDFHEAMKTEQSKLFYEKFLNKLKTMYDAEKIKDGVFGAHMVIDICNDGPVTVDLNSNKGDKDGQSTADNSSVE